MDVTELTAWVEREVGSIPGPLEPVGYGASRATYLLTAGDQKLVVRQDTGDGPMAGTPLTLLRESRIYHALRETNVRIPLLHAVADDGSALLIERVVGKHTFEDVDQTSRDLIHDDYLDALAQLHNIDVTGLDLPGFDTPDDGVSHALAELGLWGGILDTVGTRPWPLARFALAVLRHCAPTSVARTVLCHGDVGPGNFLHEDGRVTALLDWEFGHLGDPMDDLAWWVFRGHDIKGDCGDLDRQLRRWSAATGLPIVPQSIEYYRAMVMFRWLVSAISVLERGGSGVDRSVHHSLIPILTTRLPRSLATLLDVTLESPPTAPVAASSVSDVAIDTLREDLRDVVAPALTSAEARRRLTSAEVYLAHLQAAASIGPDLRAAEHDDLATLLGSRPTSLVEAHHDLATHVVDTPERWADALQYFWRQGHRLVALWPTTAARALGEPTPIPD